MHGLSTIYKLNAIATVGYERYQSLLIYQGLFDGGGYRGKLSGISYRDGKPYLKAGGVYLVDKSPVRRSPWWWLLWWKT